MIWCLRWENENGSMGGLIPGTFPTRADAVRVRDGMQADSSGFRVALQWPQGVTDVHVPLRFIVFSRPDADVFLHDPEWKRPWSPDEDAE